MPPRATQCRRKREIVEIKLASLALLHQYPKPAPTTLGVLNKRVAKMTRGSQTAAGLVDREQKKNRMKHYLRIEFLFCGFYLLKQNSERLKRSQSCIS